MNLLISHENNIIINIALAREIGLYQASILLKFHEEIKTNGIKKDGIKQIARSEKELKKMFPWCKLSQIRKTIDNLQARGYLYISDNTLFNDNSYLYYSLNETKLRELKSITILSNEEVTELHIAPIRITSDEKDAPSHTFQMLFGAFLKACHWNKAPSLSERDRAQIGHAVKALIKEYPDHEPENLKLMVLGFDTYRKDVLRSNVPYGPMAIYKAWTDYAAYCQKIRGGKPPDPPKEWL